MCSKILIKWQKSINLIGKNTMKILGKDIFDSAQLYKFVRDIEGNIIDFGSGLDFQVWCCNNG